MDQSAVVLRRALAGRARGRGKRVAAELKTGVRAYAEARRKQGATFALIGKELGLPMESVRRWSLDLAKESEPSGAVLVHVVAEPQRGLSIVSPSGFHVDGLSLQDAAAMLRAVG